MVSLECAPQYFVNPLGLGAPNAVNFLNMFKLSRAVALPLIATSTLALASCGSPIEPMSLPNAYHAQVPDPANHDGKVISEGPMKSAGSASSVTTRYNYFIGYKKLKFEDLSTWLEENTGASLSNGVRLRSTQPERPVEVPYGNETYRGEKSFCFATDRNNNFAASDSVNITPLRTEGDADYPVALDITVSKNSLGCPDSEYFADVKPLIDQRGQSRDSIGDIIGDAIDSYLN